MPDYRAAAAYFAVANGRIPIKSAIAKKYDATDKKSYNLVNMFAMTLHVITKSFKIKVGFVAALLKLILFDKYKKSALDQWGGFTPGTKRGYYLLNRLMEFKIFFTKTCPSKFGSHI